jgi:putative nucleotidyltransferase with HDIG domain
LDERVRNLVNASPRLATPPAAYFRLCKVLDDPASTGPRVAEIVRTDPSLTARVLRVSNSVAYNQKDKVESVLHAVVLLGTNRIRQMALAAAVQDVFRGIPSGLLDMRAFWEHSIAVALCSELIGRHLRVDTENAFIAGLLHDIGLLVICMNLPEDGLKMLKASEKSQRDLHIVEQDLLGYDHAEVGAELLTGWNLGVHAEIARRHNDPVAAVDPIAAEMVHLADIVAIEMKLGWTGERVSADGLAASCERLRLSRSDLDALANALQGQVGQVAMSYG